MTSSGDRSGLRLPSASDDVTMGGTVMAQWVGLTVP